MSMIFLAKPNARNGVKLIFPAIGKKPGNRVIISETNARNEVR